MDSSCGSRYERSSSAPTNTYERYVGGMHQTNTNTMAARQLPNMGGYGHPVQGGDPRGDGGGASGIPVQTGSYEGPQQQALGAFVPSHQWQQQQQQNQYLQGQRGDGYSNHGSFDPRTGRSSATPQPLPRYGVPNYAASYSYSRGDGRYSPGKIELAAFLAQVGLIGMACSSLLAEVDDVDALAKTSREELEGTYGVGRATQAKIVALLQARRIKRNEEDTSDRRRREEQRQQVQQQAQQQQQQGHPQHQWRPEVLPQQLPLGTGDADLGRDGGYCSGPGGPPHCPDPYVKQRALFSVAPSAEYTVPGSNGSLVPATCGLSEEAVGFADTRVSSFKGAVGQHLFHGIPAGGIGKGYSSDDGSFHSAPASAKGVLQTQKEAANQQREYVSGTVSIAPNENSFRLTVGENTIFHNVSGSRRSKASPLPFMAIEPLLLGFNARPSSNEPQEGEEVDGEDHVRKIEADLHELGGRMVGSILDS